MTFKASIKNCQAHFAIWDEIIYTDGMRVAIISAYHGEDLETIRRCHDSVLAQTHPSDHFLIGDGRPSDAIDDWKCQHVKLSKAHADYGDTPRAIGTLMAYTQGYDALCWLDADNWLEPEHVATAIRASKGDVVTMPRMLRWPDGSVLGQCTESDGWQFNDTNCYFVPREFMHLGAAWGFKTGDAAVGDRHIWATYQTKARVVRSTEATINYTTTIAMHYLERNLVPPPEAKVLVKFSDDGPFEALPYTEFLRLTGRA